MPTTSSASSTTCTFPGSALPELVINPVLRPASVFSSQDMEDDNDIFCEWLDQKTVLQGNDNALGTFEKLRQTLVKKIQNTETMAKMASDAKAENIEIELPRELKLL